MSSPAADRRESRFLIVLFVLALGFNLYGVTYHWTMGFMAGHEFRQAHTAIVAYHIDQQNNFSLLYETPIFGKPWVSLLLEVPIYEWAVVGLSRLTGLPHVIAARTITAACFYLTLPALWLLLGRLALPKPRRLLVLALVLSAPVYIFYSRAFLMDSMALMASAWWLVAFVRTMDERRWGWLGLAVVAGTLAALVKSAILAVWMVPGAAYGAWLLGRDLRAGAGWRAPLRTLLWGLATVVVALGCLRAWVAYTDPIKAAHASAWIFTSKNLSQGNWGLFDFDALFSAQLWRYLLACWEQAIMSRWMIAALLVAGLALPTARGRVAGAAACFLAAQILFPFAYAYQDYYFYACAVFLHGALGWALLALWDSRLPRWAAGVVMLAVLGAQGATYWRDYRVQQSVVHHGGYPFTDVIRELTPKQTVIIVAGADWAAMSPLYAQRKALMIRNGLEHDHAYLERAFNDLAGEEVSALVVYGPLRQNKDFINKVAERFDLDARAPTFSFVTTADTYLARLYAKGAQLRLKNSRRYPDLTIPPEALAEIPTKGRAQISPAIARDVFINIRPGPYQMDFEFGLDWLGEGAMPVLSAHPNSDLWVRPPPHAKQIRWSYGIFAGAYEKPEARTDGVEFIIHGELPDGTSREIYHRLLDPAQNPADRPDQHEVIAYEPRPEESLRFSTRPHQSSAYDWAYTIRIEVK
ncbi:ArnT family glycosyltransferase [Lacunisphaera limnophila]|nr:glycosyltransferase family 39 protein [Lacunisphaera limnophila]